MSFYLTGKSQQAIDYLATHTMSRQTSASEADFLFIGGCRRTLAVEHGLGKGAYYVTGMQNENQGQVIINLDVLTNLYYRAATLRQEIRAVDAVSKLTTTWGELKSVVR